MKTEPSPRPLSVSFKGAEARTGIPWSTWRDWVRQGKVPARVFGNGKIKRRYVILLDDVEDYVRSLPYSRDPKP